jgi:hypothetical protein
MKILVQREFFEYERFSRKYAEVSEIKTSQSRVTTL